MDNTNPPQMTWESIVKQRMYDFLNAYSTVSGSTERGIEIIELAIRDLRSSIASAVESAREEGRREERREILAAAQAKYDESLAFFGGSVEAAEISIHDIREIITSREFSEEKGENLLDLSHPVNKVSDEARLIDDAYFGTSEGGKCCKKCAKYGWRDRIDGDTESAVRCMNPDCGCHTNKAV
jgi:hypothetical protein